jgi:hypothetical protein
VPPVIAKVIGARDEHAKRASFTEVANDSFMVSYAELGRAWKMIMVGCESDACNLGAQVVHRWCTRREKE